MAADRAPLVPAAGPSASAPSAIPQPSRRDSRLAVDHHQSPIVEEDESAETASEHTEAITPTSDSPGSHSLSAHGPSLPPPLHAMKPPPRPQAALVAPDPKPTLTQRVGSFVRNKLHRTASNNNNKSSSPAGRLSVDTALDGPRNRPSLTQTRSGSAAVSMRLTPKSSTSNSPPSPGSPSSTVSQEQDTPRQQPVIKRLHSASSTALPTNSPPSRSGITWAAGGAASASTSAGPKPPHFVRQRSASSETANRAPPEGPTVGLVDAFSRPAAEGVGMKARRLSLSLPDEFVVDSCELDEEFKSSTLMPGKRGRVLGRGATAEVRIMARRGIAGGEELVAVKEFRGRDRDESEDDYIQKIKSEYSIAKSLHHPNIVDTVRLCTHHGRWNHVMEYCGYGELFTLVERRLFRPPADGGFYSPNDRLCFFKQLLRGVDYLHSHGIAHRDIKLENILLNRDGHLKLSDFGVAEVFTGEHPGMRTAKGECGKNMGVVRLSKPGICGSLPYIAPEVLAKHESYDPRRLDVWSCAIVFLTMTFGGSPWQAAREQSEQYARFARGWDDWLAAHPDGVMSDGPDGHPKCGRLFGAISPPSLKRLLLKMLRPQPDLRVVMRDVLASPSVRAIDCCCPEAYDDGTPCAAFDSSKAPSRQAAARLALHKKYLHHHVPPQGESRIQRAFTHRFDMG